MAKRINIRPTTSVYATYKNLKYDPWTAIAEFVDNSSQSYYDNSESLKSIKYWGGLDIEISYSKEVDGSEMLVISDNAYGMNFDDFKRAIVLDSPPNRKSRSEFGMGLKTAACWFGLKWSVETVELGSGIKYKAAVDVEMLHKYRNEFIEVEESKVSTKEHGTIIRIWNLNRGISSRQIGKTKDQLRGIYRSDLRSGEIRIYYNNEQLIYSDPEVLTEKLPDGSDKTWRMSVDFEIKHQDKVYKVDGFIALLKRGSTSNAGFALMKNGRVIVGGYENHYRPEEIFEKPNSFVYQRLIGELNLDSWPVVQTKDAFDWYDGLEDIFVSELSKISGDYIKKAKEIRKDKKLSIESDISVALDNFERVGVIENPQVKTIDQPNQDVNHTDESDHNHSKESILTDSEVEYSKGKKILFRSNGKDYTFNLMPQINNPYKQWLYISKPNPESNEYNIEWNLKHPFFKSYVSDSSYYELITQFIFALSLAEIEASSTAVNNLVSPSAIRLSMNEMFKNVMDGGVKDE